MGINMAFLSLQQMIDTCQTEKKEFWEVVLEDDLSERKATREESMAQMYAAWDAMLLAVALYDEKLTSASGLVGGDGGRMEAYARQRGEESLCGSFLDAVIAEALKMGESNACMKRIVAAPTAGACGVLPALLVPYFRRKKCDAEKIVQAMYVAAGIGQVIAERASISGAAGGCQAEIGSASAMAAGAMAYLQGGDEDQICDSAAMALKSFLGLVCDPVAGLVEVPCVKRNVAGAVSALSCAEMALAGITSQIPPDQVIDAMKEIGDKMDVTLRETARGGLALTPKAAQVEEMLNRH